MLEASGSHVVRAVSILIAACLAAFPAYAKYSGGTGEPNDPYQIATAADLIALGEDPNDYDKHFILTADIDLDPNLPGRKVFDTAVIGVAGYRGNLFYGHSFGGVFDGSGHTISHLTIAGGTSWRLGLFGWLVGEIKDLGLIDVNVSGLGCDVGGLAARNGGTISHCYSTGWVTGESCVGGLVGTNSVSAPGWVNPGVISECHSTGVITGKDSVGGLVGDNHWGSITTSYSSGLVSGDSDVGGLVGTNPDGSITASYSTGSVSGTSSIGGLVGWNDGTIATSYSTGSVTGTSDVGGLVGDNYLNSSVTWSFWDVQTSGQTWSAGGTGLTTSEMQTAWSFTCWVGDRLWTIDEGRDCPRLSWENARGVPLPRVYYYGGGSGSQADPYLIYTADELRMVGLTLCDWDKHFRLMADIDLSAFDGKDGRPAFSPIGAGYYDAFIGVFDGNGHRVFHLTVTGEGCIGLFGGLGPGAEVKDLAVVDVNVTGSDSDVGGLVGENREGTVMRCYSTGMVTGRSHVGGLIGFNSAGLTHCYSTGVVIGDSDVGGLVGTNGGEVSDCYSAGTVIGNGEGAGGLIGVRWVSEWAESIGGTVTACVWNVQTSGQATSAGGTGKTTAEMQTAATFLEAGWDFVGEAANGTNDIWKIAEGLDYPRLWWEPYDGRVTVVLGQVFTVTLESNPSTGYRWEWVDHQDSTVEQMGEAQFKPRETGDPPLVGAGGWESFDFKAVHPGQMTLKLVYRRPWEEGVEPLKTFLLQVTVP